MEGGHIGNPGRRKKGVDLVVALRAKGLDPLVHSFHPAERRSKHDRRAFGIRQAVREARVRHRLLGRRQRKLRTTRYPAGFLDIHIPAGIEPFDFAGYPAGQGGSVELRDRTHAGFPGQESFPEFGDGQPQRGDRAHSGDDNTGAWIAHFILSWWRDCWSNHAAPLRGGGAPACRLGRPGPRRARRCEPRPRRSGRGR